MAEYQFDDLVEAVAVAAMHAVRIADDQHRLILDRYFEEDPDNEGALRARTVRISIPNPPPVGTEKARTSLKDEQGIDVPLISLIPIRSLVLKDLEIQFTARLTGMEKKARTKESRQQHDKLHEQRAQLGETMRARLDLSRGRPFVKKDNEVNVTISFTGGDPPEGIAKVNDQILKKIP